MTCHQACGFSSAAAAVRPLVRPLVLLRPVVQPAATTAAAASVVPLTAGRDLLLDGPSTLPSNALSHLTPACRAPRTAVQSVSAAIGRAAAAATR